MGIVYRARDEAMGREVALKVLTADIEDDPDIRTRFLREAEAAARLSHPNIITIFDVGEEHERFFIVMELLRGATLKDFLNQPDGARLERKIDLMVQLAGGLGAAHNASVYHRDIKPGNVFVRSDGLLKILDFGVARLASSSMTASGFIVGTPDYMSPEQARGIEVDGRSDIFSLGGVFYFMLTGRKPFPASDLPTLFHQIQSNDPPPPIDAEAPPELVEVIMRALEKKKEARYQSCQELLADLNVLKHLYPVEVLPASVASRIALANAAHRPATQPMAAAAVAESAPASETEDTVDLRPPSAPGTDDTVTLEAPTWVRRVAGRIDSAIAGAFAKFKGSPTTSVSTRPTGMRKR
jgi:serine/threonine-protein kinase